MSSAGQFPAQDDPGMLWTGGPQSITAAAMGLDNVLPPEAFFSFPGANDTNQGPFDMLTMPLNPCLLYTSPSPRD